MPTLNDTDPSVIYAMFKGEPGLRKSTQALSFPGPQYWFDWDRKMSGLIVPMRKWGLDPTQISYDSYDDWLKARIKLEQLQIKCPYKTIVIDSLTSCADTILRQTLKLKAGTTRASGNTAGRSIAGITVNEMEDYNAETSALNELIAITKDIHTFHKVNVILIAHVMEVSKQVGDKLLTARTIVTAGKRVAAKIPAYCGEVYHFHIKAGANVDLGGEYSLLTESTGTDFARSALNLPKEIVFKDQPIYGTYIQPAITKLVNPTNNG